MVKNLPTIRETWVQSLGWEDSLEEGMATHSNILAWRIPWTEKPGGLQSMGSQSRTWLTDSDSTAQDSDLQVLLEAFFLPRLDQRIGRWLCLGLGQGWSLWFAFSFEEALLWDAFCVSMAIMAGIRTMSFLSWRYTGAHTALHTSLLVCWTGVHIYHS